MRETKGSQPVPKVRAWGRNFLETLRKPVKILHVLVFNEYSVNRKEIFRAQCFVSRDGRFVLIMPNHCNVSVEQRDFCRITEHRQLDVEFASGYCYPEI